MVTKLLNNKSKLKIDRLPGDVIYNLYYAPLEEKQEIEKVIIKLCKLYGFLSEYLDFPKHNLLDHPTEELEVEDLAIKLREFWKLGVDPIESVMSLFEKNGIIVAIFDGYVQNCSSMLQDGRDLIVLDSTKVNVLNQNFNLAHALAHHYYYNDIAERFMSKEAKRNFERRSAKFAAVFLLPKESFMKDIESAPGKLKTYTDLSFKWFVSANIMIARAYDLKIIKHETYRKLLDEYALKRSSIKSVSIRDIPALSKSTGVLINECGLSREDIVSGTGISSSEIELLLHLDSGSFKIEKDNILEFKGPTADNL